MNDESDNPFLADNTGALRGLDRGHVIPRSGRRRLSAEGGGQALVAGGIDPRVTFVATGVPAICDHSGRAAGRINGWPKLVPTGVNGEPDAVILQASRYVDAVNFASRCRADAIMSVGFIDAVCPPSSCYAAYSALQGSKQIINEPLMGHAAPQHIRDAFLAQIQTHVRKKHSE
ncbi:MAG: acetylxylan esterase [Planctomycetes bacterium]|nr:acetylxylan esterase [Planctomycetota bacterium]